VHHFKLFALSFLLLAFAFSDWQGQFSTIGDLRKTEDGYLSQIGVRYIPEWSLVVPWPTAILDTEISFNINGLYKQPQNGRETTDFDVSPYRFWFRRSTNNLEIRAGLQKITFGTARIFRSLMWFDTLDPRDPLQLTKGVWGLRVSRDFDNNANAWVWGLLWNNDPKGYELIPTKKNNFEFGGRFQIPFWRGEIGVSGHNRIISKNDLPEYLEINTMSNSTPEARAGIDGYFDVGIGLWFESSVVRANYGADFPNWQSFLTVGSDYTLGIGNGITVTAEHFIYSTNDKPYGSANNTQMTGIMALYPISLFDTISGMMFYSWDAELAYFFLSWQRTYDDWTINLNTFFSSDSDVPFSLNSSISDFSSRGIQLMLIFDH